jgi:MFS family permease
VTTQGYRWIIVAAGAVLACVAVGTMFTLPVFLVPMGRATGWSRTGVSLAMTVGFLAIAFGSIVWGTITDRFGARIVVLIGSILLAVSIALASVSRSLLEFQLAFGVLAGIATSAILAPVMATVTGWFDTHRSVAVSLVWTGIGLAPLTMSPLAGWLVSHHDWRTAFLIIAAIIVVVMIPASFCVRRPPPLRAQADPSAVNMRPTAEMSVREAVRTPQFIVLLLTNFCCCATHSGPIFHTVSYAIACGVAPMAAVSIYSMEGLAGLGGRLGFGALADRLGAKRVLVAGLLVQAFCALGYYFAHSLSEFYAVAALFGFTYAGVMPLYAVIARENFPLRMMGTIIGAGTMASNLGMATGPLLGGWIFDTTGGYGWLYIDSFGLGLGAALIAVTFKPFPRTAQESRAIDRA